MANVKGREVSDGSENVIYRSAVGTEAVGLTVAKVTSGENVKYKLAGAGEIPAAVVFIQISGVGFPYTFPLTLS